MALCLLIAALFWTPSVVSPQLVLNGETVHVFSPFQSGDCSGSRPRDADTAGVQATFNILIYNINIPTVRPHGLCKTQTSFYFKSEAQILTKFSENLGKICSIMIAEVMVS